MRVSLGEREALAADKPLVCAPRNILRDYRRPAEWRNDGRNQWTSGRDWTAPGFPTDVAHDDLLDVTTKPSPPDILERTRALLFDLTSSPGGWPNEADCAAILGHNLGKISGITTIAIQRCLIGDGSFRRFITWDAWMVDNNIRRVSFNFNNFQRYTGVQFLRVLITNTNSFRGGEPELGEVVIGRRRQLGHHGDEPFVRVGLETTLEVAQSKTGADQVYVHNEGRAVLARKWTPVDRPEAFGLNDSATILSWFRDSGRGSRRFLWVERPMTDPLNAHWMRFETPTLQLIAKESEIEEFSCVMREQPPYADVEHFGVR